MLKQMKPKAIIFLFSLLFVITSCTSEISIAEFVNPDFPLVLTINRRNNDGLTETDKKIIEPQSKKSKKLIGWCNRNSSGWENAIGSYKSKIYVTQNNFNLLYLGNTVVINFTDKNGKQKQYSKAIENGELDFLIE